MQYNGFHFQFSFTVSDLFNNLQRYGGVLVDNPTSSLGISEPTFPLQWGIECLPTGRPQTRRRPTATTTALNTVRLSMTRSM